KGGSGEGIADAVVAAGEGADVELIDEEVFEGRRGERGAVVGEQGWVNDIAPGGRVGAFNLEGTGVGAQMGLGGVVVLPRGRGDAVLVARVGGGRNAVGRPVRGTGFIGEREGGSGDGMVEDDFDKAGKMGPDTEPDGFVRIREA